MKYLVTGATGFVGSHIAEKLVQDGQEVIAFVRESSDTSFLKELGVEIRYGTINNPESIYNAAKGVDCIVHAAASTDEWLPKEITYDINVNGTANVLQAASDNDVKRFIYISSLAVMGFKSHFNTGESTEYVKPGDPYIDSKMEAEKLVWKFGAFGLDVTVMRPGFMYGPRDRRFMKRILGTLDSHQFKFIGSGNNMLNLNYVGNFADAVVLAAKTDKSIGQAYNIANEDTTLDSKTFIYKVADLWGYERPEKHIPTPVANVATSMMEGYGRLVHKKEPPLLTKTRLKFFTHILQFDITKAKQELGFENRIGIDEGLKLTKEWIEKTHAYD